MDPMDEALELLEAMIEDAEIIQGRLVKPAAWSVDFLRKVERFISEHKPETVSATTPPDQP